jgi:DNA-binding transcriptional LysR family regulator
LFIHRKRPVKATLRGQLLLDVAQHLLAQVDQAKEPPATA